MGPMPPSSPDATPLPPVWQTLRRFLPYLWPADAPALRRRVTLAMVFVVLAKTVTLLMPFAYKGAVDRMAPGLEPAAGLAKGYGPTDGLSTGRMPSKSG